MKIAILRGINVGGKRKIMMADLRLLFEKQGFTNVRTYIQSGNVLFQNESEVSAAALASTIEQAIADQYGFEVPVIVRTAEELAQSVQQNPFYKEDADIKELHLTFLKETPSEENRLKTEGYDYLPDQFVIDDKAVFIRCLGKYHQSKLSNNFFEKKLQVSATTRNWKTVLKLVDLSKA